MARGKLRIYLGAAPGVGKTVAMLDEGRRRASRGTDVVVGLCETHGRAYTASLLRSLEVVPRRRIEYRGTTMDELDVDAVLARHPQVALVDELAHTNVPGSRNDKRYQDVLALLDAGIDVISTVNIQHLESLNDTVAAITGVVQHETVPDEIVREADQIELVDMSPDALRRRMTHGHIYSADKIDAALANYFRPGNLSALRELALLWLADNVAAGLDDYRAAHGISQSWPVRERVVVALSGHPGGDALLRRGARVASRVAGGELLAVYVTRRDGLTSAPLGTVAKLQEVTKELGGEFHTIVGDDPAKAVLDFARGVNATQILVGTTHLPLWRRSVMPGVVNRIIDGAGDIDVHVVNRASAGLGFERRRSPGLPTRRVLAGMVAAVCLPVALTGLLHLGGGPAALTLDIPLLLLATVVVALIGGIAPAIVAAIVSSLLLNWFFVPPLHTLTVTNPENALALVAFMLVGVLVAGIVHLNARWRVQAQVAGRESAALAELSHSLLGSNEQVPLLLRRAVDMFGAQAAALVKPSPFGLPQVIVSVGDFDPAAAGDHERVDDTYELALQPPGLPAWQRRLFAAFAAHAGAIVQREALADQAATAGAAARDNAAKTALLSAVSHDLRTPLAGIKAAIGSLRSTDVTWTRADEEELKAVIEESADRLESLIGNLLHLSRLQTGGVVAHAGRVDLRDVIPAVIRQLPDPGRVAWTVEPDAAWVLADPGLVDRVLGNVVENALRYQPATAPVHVTASHLADRVEIRVVDTGVGVPAEERERIFEPFQQPGDVPGGGGLGLGLAVARGLAEAMGGATTAEPTPGGGLTVVIALPVWEAADEQHVTDPSSDVPTDGVTGSHVGTDRPATKVA